jgi:hypothetical protein
MPGDGKPFTTETAKVAGAASRRSKKAERQLMRYLAKQGLTDTAISSIKDVLVELIRAANSNPLVGILLCISVVDVGQRTGLLSKNAATAMYAVIAAVTGTEVVADVITALEQGLHLFGAGGSPPSPLTPSATTIVYAAGPSVNGAQQALPDLQALLAKMKP